MRMYSLFLKWIFFSQILRLPKRGARLGSAKLGRACWTDRRLPAQEAGILKPAPENPLNVFISECLGLNPKQQQEGEDLELADTASLPTPTPMFKFAKWHFDWCIWPNTKHSQKHLLEEQPEKTAGAKPGTLWKMLFFNKPQLSLIDNNAVMPSSLPVPPQQLHFASWSSCGHPSLL